MQCENKDSSICVAVIKIQHWPCLRMAKAMLGHASSKAVRLPWLRFKFQESERVNNMSGKQDSGQGSSSRDGFLCYDLITFERLTKRIERQSDQIAQLLALVQA
ncbi:hypothetical protein Scep_021976 [Stephania cephalantha]|uniref:Uncharacterized protein n=1 Tax=Stephania cephalantha TaxID=152367 RepID=A0AAP0I0M3_9MAGN